MMQLVSSVVMLLCCKSFACMVWGGSITEEAGSVLNQEMTPRASRFPCIVDLQTSWVGRIPILILGDFCCYKMVSRILMVWFP